MGTKTPMCIIHGLLLRGKLTFVELFLKEDVLNKKFKIKNLNLSKLWHCFGNSYHLASLDDIVGLLRESGANILPVNTHNLDYKSGRKGLELGYKGILLDDYTSQHNIQDLTIMLNINLQTSANYAIAKTLMAYELTGEKVIKLEVLNRDHATSNQREIIKAYKGIKAIDDSFLVFPLIDNEYAAAKELVYMGCPLLRVMGSAIGACGGISNQKEFKKICGLGVPVILDGGIGKVEDAIEAMELGAEGVLVNSMLFEQKQSPVEVMQDFAKRFYSVANPCVKAL